MQKKLFERYHIPTGVKRYFANTSWIMIEKILRMFIQLFVGIYVLRYLGPKQFGILTYAYSFVAIFSAFTNLGLESIVMRNLVIDKDNAYKILGTSFYLKSIGVAFSFLSVYVALKFTSNDPYTKTIVMIVTCWLLFDPLSVIDYYFRSQVQARLSSIAQMSMYTLSSAIRIIFILIKAPLICFAWMIVGETFIFTMVLIFLYVKQRLPILKWSLDIRMALDLLKDSWPLFFSSMVIIIYMRIDQIMIKEMLDSESVGIYGASVRFSEAWYFIPIALHHSLLPAVVNAKNISEDLYYKRIQALFDLSVWCAIIIAIPTIIFADLFIPILLGNAFQPAVSVLNIQIWASVFIFLGVSIGQWFVVENLQKFHLYRALSGAVVNVLLNLFLIPSMGIKGAAIATVISQFIASYASLFVFKNTRHIFWIASKSFNIFLSFKRIILFFNENKFTV